MNSPQAQYESERPYWFEQDMTESEQRDYEAWLESVYWSMRAEEKEGEF